MKYRQSYRALHHHYIVNQTEHILSSSSAYILEKSIFLWNIQWKISQNLMLGNIWSLFTLTFVIPTWMNTSFYFYPSPNSTLDLWKSLNANMLFAKRSFSRFPIYGNSSYNFIFWASLFKILSSGVFEAFYGRKTLHLSNVAFKSNFHKGVSSVKWSMIITLSLQRR